MDLLPASERGKACMQLLLLLWKTILSCLGGQKELARTKALVREIEGLPADKVTKRGGATTFFFLPR